MQRELNRRILLIDDNPSIHDDFRKALAPRATGPTAALLNLEADLFGDSDVEPTLGPEVNFEIDSALQGAEGVQMLRRAIADGRPYALAFVDIRMPPGWDGVETIERLWAIDPELQVAICSAYSDYTGGDIRRRLGESDGLLILKKPFDTTEVVQLAYAMTHKWSLQQAQRDRTAELDELVSARTRELEQSNRALAAEMLRRERIEVELRLAQKLEAIGQLAAGIAHEINTPTQYVCDSLDFLRSSYDDLETLRTKLRAALAQREANRDYHQAVQEIEHLEREIDIDYITKNAPSAFDAARDGLVRIRRIVQAMRVFGHHDGEIKSPTDLNSIVQSTIDISRSEHDSIATVETALGPLPPVTCCAGELGQVFLNLIVNAAHAIEPVVKETGTKGTISITTTVDAGEVVVSIEDTGCGIPEPICDRIFDQFFTTKEVGRGTGQGLSIARSIVVDRHRGRIDVQSVVGRGTTFTVRVPIAPRQ